MDWSDYFDEVRMVQLRDEYAYLMHTENVQH
jgi:hypothetical protein